MEFNPEFTIQEAKDAIRRYYHTDHDPWICLSHARRNYEEARDKSSDPTTTLEALIGLSYTYGYLADIEASLCIDHARSAVATAESAISFCQEHAQNTPSMEARVYDAFGCALRQRYVYLGAVEDCDGAVEAQRRSLELTTPDDSPLALSVRRSHLVKALYIQSRGSRHNHSVHKQSLLEAVDMGQKYECNGASTPFTPITGGLLFLCSRLWIDGRSRGERNLSTNSSQSALSQNEGESQGIETQLRIVIKVMESNYAIITRLYGPRHTRVAAELGSFSASLLTIHTSDRAEGLAVRCRDMLHALADESYQIDLRYVTLLMDILHTLVTDHESMPDMPTTDLVKVICRRLHQMLPKTHMERPELHYLLGLHLSSQHGRSGALGHQDNFSHAITQFRKALALTPDNHPSRAQYLISLVLVRLGSLDISDSATQAPEMKNILQELMEWGDDLRSLRQATNMDPISREQVDHALTALEQAQRTMSTQPVNTAEVSPSPSVPELPETERVPSGPPNVAPEWYRDRDERIQATRVMQDVDVAANMVPIKPTVHGAVAQLNPRIPLPKLSYLLLACSLMFWIYMQ